MGKEKFNRPPAIWWIISDLVAVMSLVFLLIALEVLVDLSFLQWILASGALIAWSIISIAIIYRYADWGHIT